MLTEDDYRFYMKVFSGNFMFLENPPAPTPETKPIAPASSVADVEVRTIPHVTLHTLTKIRRGAYNKK